MDTISIAGMDGRVNDSFTGMAEPPAVPVPAAPDAGSTGGTSAPPPADTLFLPDGTPLRLTLSRKIWLGRIFGRDEDDAWSGPNRPLEDQAVLYLAGNPPSVWLAPGREDGGSTRFLIQRTRAFQEAMDTWTDEKMPDFSVEELRDLAAALWDGEHATQVVALSKKKEMRRIAVECSPTGASST